MVWLPTRTKKAVQLDGFFKQVEIDFLRLLFKG